MTQCLLVLYKLNILWFTGYQYDLQQHIVNTKVNTCVRNNILRKFTTMKWSIMPFLLKSKILISCNSIVEYACSMWERSCQGQKVLSIFDNICCLVISYLKSNNTKNFIFASIGPPKIIREVVNHLEFWRQTRHPNSIRASTNQGQGQGFNLFLPQAAVLPRLDVGSGVVKPTLSCIIQNLQTSYSP